MGKTAVVIVHGIGEQSPMETVRGFVRFFAGRFFRSKPDPLAQSFELRRLSTLAHNEAKALEEAKLELSEYPPDTVFYEYYWAFHYRNTKPVFVVRWLFQTLARLFRSGQVRTLGQRTTSVLLAVIAALFILAIALGLIAWGIADMFYPGAARIGGVFKVLFGLFLPRLFQAFRPVLLSWVGDAARYFDGSPENPIERQQIRADGVALLERLHAKSEGGKDGDLEYDRIVIVGHSLGSVIAYDMITHYWSRVNTKIQMEPNLSELAEIESLTQRPLCPTADAQSWTVPPEAATADKYMTAQAALVARLKSPDWRITDLVTLGSPLTYGRFLLAHSAAELAERQSQRELPTCPPVRDESPDQNNRRSFVYSYGPVTGNRVVPHHAAPFLLTQWTNMFFPGDPIGGPLAPYFGWGIRDVEVSFAKKNGNGTARSWLSYLLDRFGGAHIRYWELLNGDPKSPLSPDCAEMLRRIISRRPS